MRATSIMLVPYVARQYRQPLPVLADSTSHASTDSSTPCSPSRQRSRPYPTHSRHRLQTSSPPPFPPPPPPVNAAPLVILDTREGEIESRPENPIPPAPPPLPNFLNVTPVPAAQVTEQKVSCSGYEIKYSIY